MNRREAIASLLSVAGAGATVTEIKEEPQPLLFVLYLDDIISDEGYCLIRGHWENTVWHGAEKAPPLLILPSGMKLEAVIDPRHKETQQ
jgi:hypothetical protein